MTRLASNNELLLISQANTNIIDRTVKDILFLKRKDVFWWFV